MRKEWRRGSGEDEEEEEVEEEEKEEEEEEEGEVNDEKKTGKGEKEKENHRTNSFFISTTSNAENVVTSTTLSSGLVLDDMTGQTERAEKTWVRTRRRTKRK